MSNHRWTFAGERWDYWDGREDSDLLSVIYHLAGGADGPNSPVIEVELVEADRWVIVTLYSRNGGGGRPFGKVRQVLTLQLERPLGTRKVYDGGIGERRNPLAKASDTTLNREGLDAALERSKADEPWASPRRFTQ